MSKQLDINPEIVEEINSGWETYSPGEDVYTGEIKVRRVSLNAK